MNGNPRGRYCIRSLNRSYAAVQSSGFNSPVQSGCRRGSTKNMELAGLTAVSVRDAAGAILMELGTDAAVERAISAVRIGER